MYGHVYMYRPVHAQVLGHREHRIFVLTTKLVLIPVVILIVILQVLLAVLHTGSIVLQSCSSGSTQYMNLLSCPIIRQQNDGVSTAKSQDATMLQQKQICFSSSSK